MERYPYIYEADRPIERCHTFMGRSACLYGFSLFKMSTQRVGILNYNPPASRVVTIVIRKNHLSVLYVLGQVTFKSQLE